VNDHAVGVAVRGGGDDTHGVAVLGGGLLRGRREGCVLGRLAGLDGNLAAVHEGLLCPVCTAVQLDRDRRVDGYGGVVEVV